MNAETPDTQPAPVAKSGRRGRKSRPAYRTPAILLAAIGLMILGLLIFVPTPQRNVEPNEAAIPGHASKNSRAGAAEKVDREPAGGKGSAATYYPLPALEALIGSQPRRVQFRVLSPDEIVEKGKLIVFRWNSEREGPWKVTILNNKGVTLKEEEVKDPEYTLSYPTPGLYYWTVAREDELLHVGRLVVR
jgi:hypothetical protein